MVEREVEVINTLGLHARPSGMILQTAQKYKSSISIANNGVVADTKSIMSILMLSATYGSKVKIRATGVDEEAAVAAIEDLFLRKFDEE